MGTEEAEVTETTVAQVMAELAELEDPRIREANESTVATTG